MHTKKLTGFEQSANKCIHQTAQSVTSFARAKDVTLWAAGDA
jgi:hypothetical protein